MQDEPIIQARKIGKEYKIGTDKVYKTIAESLMKTVKNPLKTIMNSRQQQESFWALKDINFDVQKGDVVGIVGKNGAGKSTLLKILSRITYPTEGTVLMNGRVGSLLEVGTGFHSELTGIENIYFNGAVLGMRRKEIDAKLEEIVKFSGVENFLTTPVKRYSSGMVVRLAFSVAAHLEPEIMIIDEVLAVGDIAFQKKCLGKMNEVAESGRTILFVSHNMGAVAGLCKSGLYLSGGKITKEGDISTVIDAYLTNLDQEMENVAVFEDDKNKDMCITSVGVYATNSKNTSTFDINDELELRIDYVVKKDLTGTNIYLSLDHYGAGVIKLFDIDYDQDLYVMRKQGSYSLTIKIPKRFLNIGHWSISADCGRPNIGVIDVKHHCMNFTIASNTEDLSHSGLGRGGAIIPQFEVETSKR
jgi:lipopolysaccharide transport system ATP-binding protein